MNRNDPYEVAKAIAALRVWSSSASHSWALVPQLSAETWFVTCLPESSGSPAAGRLALFPDFVNFQHFILSRQMPDFGVWTNMMEFRHWEVIASRGGGAEIFGYRPGFVPRPPDEEERKFLAPLLYECYGVMMRIEEDPQLTARYSEKGGAMFARKEMSEAHWQDGPLPVSGRRANYVESIALNRDRCAAAARMPVVKGEVWEVDFALMPAFRTNEPQPRFLYLMAAVDAAGRRRAWVKMSLSGTDEALKKAWEGLAERLLEAMLSAGIVPGEVHVRSGRMARFLRPLGMQLPFKLVRNVQLQALDAQLAKAIGSSSI